MQAGALSCMEAIEGGSMSYFKVNTLVRACSEVLHQEEDCLHVVFAVMMEEDVAGHKAVSFRTNINANHLPGILEMMRDKVLFSDPREDDS